MASEAGKAPMCRFKKPAVDALVLTNNKREIPHVDQLVDMLVLTNYRISHLRNKQVYQDKLESTLH